MTETQTLGQATSRMTTVMGVATIILGSLAVIAPMISGLTVSTVIGILVLAAGLCRMAYAFRAESFGKGLLTFLFGLLGVVAGAIVLARPLLGLASITMVLIVYLIAEGITELMAAARVHPVRGWGWFLFSGIMSIVLGALLWSDWPVSGAYAIGILVGIHLIFAGWSMVAAGTVGDVVSTELADAAQDLGVRQ